MGLSNFDTQKVSFVNFLFLRSQKQLINKQGNLSNKW